MEYYLFGILILILGGFFIFLYFQEILKDKKIIASPKIKMERLKICDACEHIRLKNTVYKRCSECECFLHAKTRLLNQECPIGKWHGQD